MRKTSGEQSSPQTEQCFATFISFENAGPVNKNVGGVARY